MKMLKSVIAGLAVVAAGFSVASAQQPPSSVSEFLRQLDRTNQQQGAEDAARLRRFQDELDDQDRKLAEARATLEALKQRRIELEAEKDANDVLIDELDAEFKEKQGDFTDVFTQSRSSAAELQALIDSSIISAQFPGRTDGLAAIAESQALESREALDTVWIEYLKEMGRQHEVVTFPGTVNNFNNKGLDSEVEVTRVGPFMALTNQGGLKFLVFDTVGNDNTYTLRALDRTPPNSAVKSGAKSLLASDAEDGVVRGVYDPSRGSLLKVVVQTSTLGERIADGKEVGYLIILLTIGGVLFGVVRLVQLLGLKSAVDAQARKSTPQKGNPLGRIMLAAQEASGGDLETFEFQLDNAIVRESSGIDFGMNFLKLLAAVAPLLGLLGTVTGMIATFEVIKLFGAGDPQQMAGGISQALVTTVLGLVAAIPLLFIHSFASSAARAVSQVLDEQAIGLVAEQAMKSKGARS